MNAALFFERRSNAFWIGLGLALIIFLGYIDYITGYEVSFSLFYLIPIMLAVWYGNGRLGLLLSSLSAITWFIADFASGHVYSNLLIYVWNTLLRLGFYLVVTWLGSTLRKTYKLNQDLARTDYMTGATSIGFFYELGNLELKRSQRSRRPLTLAYIDLDNFKAINDRLGHSTGDRVLREVTEAIRGQIRPTDIIGRLGGDEFGLLLPETNQEEARSVVSRLHASLVEEMLRCGWMVTFSMGAVTFMHAPKSIDEMVRTADQTMYEVKSSGKNGVKFSIYPDPNPVRFLERVQ